MLLENVEKLKREGKFTKEHMVQMGIIEDN
jgi:hypothetical protein